MGLCLLHRPLPAAGQGVALWVLSSCASFHPISQPQQLRHKVLTLSRGLWWLCPSCKGYSCCKASLASLVVESPCASVSLQALPLGNRKGQDLMIGTKLGDLSVIYTHHYRTPAPSAAPGWCYGPIRSHNPQG